jgi:hypothetical protein
MARRMPPEVHYPDLVAPLGWLSGRQGLQVRFVPPDAPADDPDVTIVVSPLVPRQPLLPPPDQVIEEAIFAEERQRFEIITKKGPFSEKTASGLTGVSFEVLGYPRPRWPREKRLYVMYADEICYYAVSYLAREASFSTHVETFWVAARSLRPFRGRLVPPTGPSPTATLYSD